MSIHDPVEMAVFARDTYESEHGTAHAGVLEKQEIEKLFAEVTDEVLLEYGDLAAPPIANEIASRVRGRLTQAMLHKVQLKAANVVKLMGIRDEEALILADLERRVAALGKKR